MTAPSLIRSSTISILAEEVTKRTNSIAVARPVRDTIRRIEDSRFTENPQTTQTIDRSQLWHMETPQVCRKDLLEKGLEIGFGKKGGYYR